MSNRRGRGVGSTGAPGENGDTCGTCHSGGSFSGAIDISLATMDGDIVSSYIPGESYTVTVQVSGQGASGYGFQAVALSSDEEQAGSFDDLGELVKTINSFGRQYIVQSGRKEDGIFSATWTAPESGTGDVTIYSSGIAANGNNNTSGDEPLLRSVTIGEAATSSTLDKGIGDLTFYPNPSTDLLHLDSDNEQAYAISDMQGKIISRGNVSTRNPIAVHHLVPGVYGITIIVDGQAVTRTFIKQ